MDDLLFLSGLGFILAHLLGWGFKHLPGERWQMLAVVPVKKGGDDHWQGSNLTYYGFFIATSQLLALTLLLDPARRDGRVHCRNDAGDFNRPGVLYSCGKAHCHAG